MNRLKGFSASAGFAWLCHYRCGWALTGRFSQAKPDDGLTGMVYHIPRPSKRAKSPGAGWQGFIAYV